MGRHKEIKETGWNDSTDRTIYRWKVEQITRSTTWTNTVRNRFRQKEGEIEVFRALEIGVAKWRKEHIPHKGNNLNDITDEGISLLDDSELWWEKQNLLWACHASRSKDRMNNDGSFVTHQLGGGVSEKGNSPISGPEEDAPNKYTQFPIELLSK
jgi:hypothetical protein